MTSNTWFFSIKTPLNPAQESALQTDFDRFTASWKSHGADVSGGVSVKYHRFVIVQSDPREDRPSGCSIDSMRKTVEGILAHHQIECVDAGHVFFRDGAGQIAFVNFRELPQCVADGTLTAGTLIFDHTLSQTDDLNRWEVPLVETWVKRYLPVADRT